MSKVNTEKYIDLGLKVGLVAGGLLLVKKVFKNAEKDTAETKILTDNNAALADNLYLLLHPLGNNWLTLFENVDEEAVIKWASNQMDFNKVRTYYSQLTKGQDLLDEVKKALNTSEYAKFTEALRKQVTAEKPKVYVYAKSNNSYASVAEYSTTEKKYKYVNKQSVKYKAKEKVGELVSEINIYFQKYKKRIPYYFVKNGSQYVFILKSQSYTK